MTPALDRINYLNIGLMLGTGVVAYFLPFHLFLGAYAILGPLHYLTEISWLHDRKYFARGRYDCLWLWALALLACSKTTEVAAWLSRHQLQPLGMAASWLSQHEPAWIALGAGLAVVLIRKPIWQIVAVATLFLSAGVLGTHFSYLTFGTLILMVHGCGSTWLFVLYGSMKAKSRSGFLSLAVMTLMALGILLAPPPSSLRLSAYLAHTMSQAGNLHYDFTRLLGWNTSGLEFVSAVRFIAFTNTYHYLNWFSKSRVIQWHRISRRRLVLIGVFYLAIVSAYAYDYRLGMQAALFAGLAHTFLEFPLNLKCLSGIFSAIKESMRFEPRALRTLSRQIDGAPKISAFVNPIANRQLATEFQTTAP